MRTTTAARPTDPAARAPGGQAPTANLPVLPRHLPDVLQSVLLPVLLPVLLLPALLPAAVPMLMAGMSRRARRLARGGEAGVSVVEWLLLTTIIAAAAIAIGAIVIGKFTTKANELDLTTP